MGVSPDIPAPRPENYRREKNVIVTDEGEEELEEIKKRLNRVEEEVEKIKKQSN